MQLRTEARDCLYLNWAVPQAALPPPPPPLRYELHRCQDEDHVFLSALLFRLTGLRPTAPPLSTLPLPSLSYPQMSLRLYVLDDDSVPSVLFRRLMVPLWVVPVSRLLGRQPAQAGVFSFPRPSDEPDAGEWSWSLRSAGGLEVEAGLSSPHLGAGPRLGDWRRTIDYFRRRPRGYVSWDGKLRAITRSHPSVEVWPVEAAIGRHDLLSRAFPQVDDARWSRLHSAWLCPEIPFSFEVGHAELLPMPRRAVAAVPDGA